MTEISMNTSNIQFPTNKRFFSLRPIVLFLGSMLTTQPVWAVEGYQDHFLDREQPIYIHGIACGDFNNPRSLKPSAVYSNAESIVEGTYYFSSKYGNFSYTLAPFSNEKGPVPQIMKRGLLSNGETDKTKMKIDLCLVDKLPGLPAQILKHVSQVHLKPNDKNWSKTMDQYAMVTGRPAFAKDQYEDPRAVATNLGHDQKVYEANQAYLKAAQVHFDKEVDRMSEGLPKALEDAIKYAHQEDGFLKTKTYPVIPKPQVWTPTSERRYNDQLFQLNTEKSFDLVIQQNFDWLFKLVGKENELINTDVDSVSTSQWKGQVLTRVVTAKAHFKDGKTLALEFEYSSEKVDGESFDTLEQIQHKSNIERNSMIVKAKKDRPLLDPVMANDLDVYSPIEKIHLFFSPFRSKEIGDSYRYQ